MLAQMKPYTPSLYRPDAYARYRQYPHTVVAPIPGVGYDVDNLAWAEQELNLDGSATPQSYGSYSMVPLRGLGIEAPGLFTGSSAAERLALYERLSPNMKSRFPASAVDALRREAAAERASIEDAARDPYVAQPLPAVEEGFFDKKLGPIPLWAVIGGGVLAAGGGAWWFMRRKK